MNRSPSAQGVPQSQTTYTANQTTTTTTTKQHVNVNQQLIQNQSITSSPPRKTIYQGQQVIGTQQIQSQLQTQIAPHHHHGIQQQIIHQGQVLTTNQQPIPTQFSQFGHHVQYVGTVKVDSKLPPVVQTIREVVTIQGDSEKIKELELIILKLRQELQTYRSKITEYETYTVTVQTEIQKIQTFEQTINFLQEENERLQKQANDGNSYISMYNQSITTLQYYEGQYGKLQDYFKQKQQENEELRRKYLQLEYDYKQLQSNDAEKQATINEINNNFEITKRSHIENIKRSEITTMKRIESLEIDLREVRKQLDQSQLDVETWHSKYINAQNQNKDNYNRSLHLEGKLNLLTQEIERILNIVKAKSDELENYKKKCVQLEAQLFRISSLEAQVSHFKEVVDAREREIQEWRGRYTKQMQTLEELRRSNSQISDYELQAQSLSSEIERLHQIIKQRQDDNENLKQTIYKYESQLTIYRSIEQDKLLLENKITLLAQEVERLTSVIQQKNEEIDQLKYRNSQLEVEAGSIPDYQNEVTRLREYLESRNREFQDLRIRYQNLENGNHNLDSTLRDYENKIALLTTEIERLSDININRANQIEEWKKRALQLESQLTSLNSVDEDNRRLREFLDQTKRERDESRQSIIKLERENYDLKNNRTELENKVAILSTEITRLNNIINDRGRQIESHRNSISKYETQLTEYQLLESKLKQYDYQINLLTQELERLNNAYRSKIEELGDAQDRVRSLEQENAQIGYYENEIRRLQEIIEKSQKDNNDLREQIYQLERRISELSQLEKIRIDLENRLALLSTEIERKDGQLKSRSDEIESLKQTISRLEYNLYQAQDLENQIQYLLSEIDRLTIANSELEEQAQVWRYKYSEVNQLQNRVTELLALHVILQSVIESLQVKLNEKDKEVQETRRSSLMGIKYR